MTTYYLTNSFYMSIYCMLFMIISQSKDYDYICKSCGTPLLTLITECHNSYKYRVFWLVISVHYRIQLFISFTTQNVSEHFSLSWSQGSRFVARSCGTLCLITSLDNTSLLTDCIASATQQTLVCQIWYV